jgi:hypothetical protein
MPTTPARSGSIERFAQLCALLDDGFAVRADILAAAGLDEAAWRALRAEWVPRLASGDAPDLALHFGRAYARARRHPGYLALALPQPVVEEDTDVDAPSVDADTDPTARTAAGGFPLAGPAMPFRVPTLLPPALNPYATASTPCQPSPMVATVDPTEATLGVPCAPSPAATALPFSSPSSDGRRQRLQRFDTQTGQPLATPIWVDDLTPPR